MRLSRNSGFPVARSVGLAMASGEFVLFLDDDDVLLPSAIDHLARALFAHPEAVAATGAELGFDEDGQWLNCVRPRARSVRHVWPDVLAGLWVTGAGRTLFRKDALEDVGGWDETLDFGEDDELWLRLARRGRAVLVPDDVLFYRFHTERARPTWADQHERAVRVRFASASPGRVG